MLTVRQAQLLRLIDTSIRETGASPSFSEMATALGLKSKANSHRLIDGLVERGFLRRRPNRARALEVLRMPPEADPLTAAAPDMLAALKGLLDCYGLMAEPWLAARAAVDKAEGRAP